MRLLIIEDSAGFRDMLTELLERQGYETLAFDDPAPALAEVDLSTVDLVILVITDLVMKNSEEQTIETVRGQGVTIPIIVLTGYLEDKDVEHFIGIGATWVLEKPIKVPQLVSSISYCSAKNTKATPPKPPPTEYSTTPLQKPAWCWAEYCRNPWDHRPDPRVSPGGLYHLASSAATPRSNQVSPVQA